MDLSDQTHTIPEVLHPLLEEFGDIIPHELPNSLPPTRDIQLLK